ncbi:unannotated protein [freshwater metagenome]|uniref:Unannotated protein n=1 Tax=freshwater metagenome TaxID=449393 RepID=A0A6J6KV08_9ZZZZ
MGLLDDRHQQFQAIGGRDNGFWLRSKRLSVRSPAGVVDGLVSNRLTPIGEHIFVEVRLGCCETLLCRFATVSNKVGGRSVVAAVNLCRVENASGREVVHVCGATEVAHFGSSRLQVGNGFHVWVSGWIPHDDLWVDVEWRDN